MAAAAVRPAVAPFAATWQLLPLLVTAPFAATWQLLPLLVTAPLLSFAAALLGSCLAAAAVCSWLAPGLPSRGYVRHALGPVS